MQGTSDKAMILPVMPKTMIKAPAIKAKYIWRLKMNLRMIPELKVDNRKHKLCKIP